MRETELQEQDHNDMDNFLCSVLDDYKNGYITQKQAVSGLAHVMAALEQGNYAEARIWFKEGHGFVRGK